MERRFTPQEKKQNRYDRDHVMRGWNTGTKYRKKLRLKKDLAERSLRRGLTVATHTMLRDAESDAPRSAKPRRVDAGPPSSVRDLIEHRLGRRAASHGAKAERRARNADWYVGVVEYWLKEIVRRRKLDDIGRLRDLRALVRSEVNDRVTDSQLAEFFRQHPAWMTKLRAWRQELWSREPTRRSPRRRQRKVRPVSDP